MRQFFESSSPQGHFFEKKPIFNYVLGECVFQISGLYPFWLVSVTQILRNTQRYTRKYRKFYRLRATNTPSVPVKSFRFPVTVHYKVVGAGM